MPLPNTSGSRLAATSLSRKWKLDVDLSAQQDGSGYQRLMGQTDFTFNPGTAGLQSDTDYDSDGYASSTATTMEWGGSLTVRRAPTLAAPTQYDPAQEFLRLKGMNTGTANSARIRVYEEQGPNSPRVEAYEGYVAVVYANSGGDPGSLSMATLTLTGQGVLLPITHPANAPLPVPVVSAVTYGSGTSLPNATGGLLILTGSGFLSATAVTVYGTSVGTLNWEAVSDFKLAVQAPAHAAGTGNVTVTNASGTSATGAGNAVTYV